MATFDETFVDWVINNTDSKQFYTDIYPKWDGNHNSNVACPFPKKHKKGIDKRPSFSININGTGGCYCHACDTKIANIVHYTKLTSEGNIADLDAALLVYDKYHHKVLKPILEADDYIRKWETHLECAPKIQAAIKDELMLAPETIEKFQLGWDIEKRRVVIPVKDKFSNLLNLRLYRLPSMRDNDKFPKILNIEGFGKTASMFPADEIFSLCRTKHAPDLIYWFTGERDTLLAWDQGLPSFSFTAGEQVCKPEWAKEIKELKATIGIVADNDKVGRESANKRQLMLEEAGITSFVVEFDDEKIKDFSDYIASGKSTNDFIQLGQRKVPYKEEKQEEEYKGKTKKFPKILAPTKLDDVGGFPVFDIGRRPEILNKPIRVNAIVSGRMDRTYSVPFQFKVGEIVYELPVSRELLLLIRTTDIEIVKQVKLWLNTKSHVEIVGHLTVTEVEIIPMIEPGKDSPYINQRCYFFGGAIECNKPYRMRIIPTTDMRTQESIGMIVEIEPVSNILDSYKFDDESYQILKENFSPDSDYSIVENLRILAHEISTRYTGILNRDDLHLVALLTWLCPLQFEFPFEGLQRAWLNTLVLGDTETGKSKVCQNIVKLFQCGVFINAESCSYVGLVGGAVKSSSGMFILRWGKIPLYNRQLVVVEELSGLTTEEISYMSEIRSAGVARYDKAGLTGETSAKTRLICLSNVRGRGQRLDDYPTGVEASVELIGQHEDLARFDLTLTVTDAEVSGDIINKDRSKEKIERFDEKELKAFQELAMFAWSLKADQIEFTLAAYRACLIQTMQLSKVYHPSIPVFKAGSGRLKLARVAISIACIQFAWDIEKQKLVVTEKHIEAAAEVLNMLYSKPSFGYQRYSKMQYDLQRVLDEHLVVAKLEETFKEKELDFLQYVSHSSGFTKFELSEALGIHQMFAERILSQFFLSNMAKQSTTSKGSWKLSLAGRKWIEKRISVKRAI